MGDSGGGEAAGAISPRIAQAFADTFSEAERVDDFIASSVSCGCLAIVLPLRTGSYQPLSWSRLDRPDMGTCCPLHARASSPRALFRACLEAPHCFPGPAGPRPLVQPRAEVQSYRFLYRRVPDRKEWSLSGASKKDGGAVRAWQAFVPWRMFSGRPKFRGASS